MIKQLKIAVGLPHYQGKSSFEHCRMWLEFGAVLNESSERFRLVSFATVDECGIDRARNKCVKHALEAGADWLLMLDADTWVSDGGDLLQMISDADRAGLTIVGAAVPRRTTGSGLTFMVYDSPKPGEFVSLTPAGILARDAFMDRIPSAFAAVDAIATACIAINMRFAQFMDEPFFRFTDIESEDLDLCRRVREMRGGWIALDDNGKPDPDGQRIDWKGLIAVDKRVRARHLNRPAILHGLDRSV